MFKYPVSGNRRAREGGGRLRTESNTHQHWISSGRGRPVRFWVSSPASSRAVAVWHVRASPRRAGRTRRDAGRSRHEQDGVGGRSGGAGNAGRGTAWRARVGRLWPPRPAMENGNTAAGTGSEATRIPDAERACAPPRPVSSHADSDTKTPSLPKPARSRARASRAAATRSARSRGGPGEHRGSGRR